MISQARRGLVPPVKTQGRPSALVPSLWVINAILVGVVILAPVSKQASTSPADDGGRIAKLSGCVSQSRPKGLAEYLGPDIQKMKVADGLVSAAPEGVYEVYALRSQSRAVAHLRGSSSGGRLLVNLGEGAYQGRWVDPGTLRSSSETMAVSGETVWLDCPAFSGASVLDLKRVD